MQLDVSEIREPDQRGPVLRERVVDVADLAGLDPLGSVRGRLLLVEVLGVDAVRIALERERPIVQVGQHGGRDAGVVRDEVAFRESGLRKQHFVPVGDLQAAPLGDDGEGSVGQTLHLVEQGLQGIGRRVVTCGGVVRGTFERDLARGLVLAESLERRRAQHPIGRPFPELDLRHQLRFDEDSLSRQLRRRVERTALALERLQAPPQLLERLLGEPRARPSRVHERAVLVVA